MKELEQKLNNKSAKIAVIGLGYSGLPLCVAFASAGFKMMGIDRQQSRVDDINRGYSYIAHVQTDLLRKQVASGAIVASASYNMLAEADVILVCVSIPLTKTKDIDLSHLIAASESISRNLHQGQLIIVQSTVAPGITREVLQPVFERSGLVAGHDFFLAYTPERVDAGNVSWNISNIPRLISGIDAESIKYASLLYKQINEHVIMASSIEVVEMAKIFENVFRSVNIALVNELALLCDKMHINVWEVITAATSKPFGYMPFYPGLGTGGHNIPLDTYYLASVARQFDFHTRFINLAAEINESMPYYLVTRIMDTLNSQNKSINKSNLLVLGITYKKDFADILNSPSIKLIEILHRHGAGVSYHDPYIKQVDFSYATVKSVHWKENLLHNYDCVIISTPHSHYNIKAIVKSASLVFDIGGITHGMKGNNVVRLGV